MIKTSFAGAFCLGTLLAIAIALGTSEAQVTKIVRDGTRVDTTIVKPIISNVRVDAAATITLLGLWQKVHPEETVACLYGEMRGPDLWVLRAREAEILEKGGERGKEWVRFNPCDSEEYIGTAHNHPTHWPYMPCGFSMDDVEHFHRDPRNMVMLVYCEDGHAGIRLYDGREGSLGPQR